MNDELLRAKGYRIRSRPANGEPLWELPGIAVLPESQAIASVQTWEREHRPAIRAKDDAVAGLIVCLAAMTIIALLALVAHGSPDRQERKPEPKRPALPDLACECQYGTITQTGRALQIEGPHWTARGTIRDDGTVFLLWTETGTGNVAPSVYRLADGILVGEWGFAPGAYLDTDGILVGDLRHDRIVRVEPAPPKIDL